MSNRAGKKFYDQQYDWLVKTDGEHCLGCLYHYDEFRGPPDVKLEIHHVRTDLSPSDEDYWDPEDIGLLCKTCNLALRYKSPEELRTILSAYRARNVSVRERMREMPHQGRPSRKVRRMVNFMAGSAEMQASTVYERLFIDWLWPYLEEHGAISKEEALNSGRVVTDGASQITLSRYLKSYTCALGPLKETKDENGEPVISFKFPVEKPHRGPGRPRKQKEQS